MTTEFVVIDHGKEVDWIDPVVSVSEDESFWYVNNGHYTYHVEKSKCRESAIRSMQ